VPVIDQNVYNPAAGAGRGAYILAEATDAEGKSATPQLIIIATGSEVALALAAREELQKDGTRARVVSMPCCELFDAQDAGYREEVLPSNVTARLAVEAGASLGWARYTGLAGDCVCLDRFGASAPGDVALRNLGFNVENVTRRARAVLARQ
jgi:transketolase